MVENCSLVRDLLACSSHRKKTVLALSFWDSRAGPG